MNNILCIITLLTVCFCENFLRLNTREWNTLKVGDSLISTLGKFKATLIESQCKFSIQQFQESNNTYLEKGYLQSKQYVNTSGRANCQNITIFQKNITTNNNDSYMLIFSGQEFIWDTIFTIDDQGIVRLVGLWYVDGQTSKLRTQVIMENKTFHTPQNFTKSVQEFNITETDMYGPMNNSRNWTFSILVNQLSIYHTNKKQYFSFYNWQRLNITDTLIFDFNLYQLPRGSFKNLTYHPRCTQPKDYLNYKAPYVFKLDPYWPIVTFYEQGGYPIIQISYSELSQYDFMQGKQSIQYYQYYSPCPQKTFLYRDRCVAECPQPYFHQMRGSIGKCVLVCQNYTPINITTRICSCMLPTQSPLMSSQIIRECPSQSSKVPYGCVCSNNTFYDSLLSHSCVQQCPTGTYASEGLCMSCPHHCLNCSLDQYHRNYLKCNQCQKGYKIYQEKGQCVKACVNNHGMSIFNDTCAKCADQNCIDCSLDPQVCNQCDILYALHEGNCTFQCDYKGIPQYAGNLTTICVPNQRSDGCQQRKYFGYKGQIYSRCLNCSDKKTYKNVCLQNCPSGTQQKNNSCLCNDGFIMVNDQCKQLPGCPIGSYYNSKIGACLNCDYGCLTCNQLYCTSCYPGFHLFLSTLASLCRRNSPIAPCDKQQIWMRGVCRLRSYTLQFISNCSELINNCEICFRDKCAVCKQNFLLHQNKCIEKCPVGMTNYTHNCILQQIPKCQIPHLSVNDKATMFRNYQDYQKSIPYQYYIKRQNQFIAINQNDPIGYIYFLHRTAFGIPYNQPKHTNFYQPKWICLKCEAGMGLNEQFTACQPCPGDCKLCYMARTDSCLDEKDNNTNNTNNTIPSSCVNYVNYQTKQCQSICSHQNQYPEFQDGILYCKSESYSSNKDYIRIDASDYKFSDGSNLFYFVFDREVKNQDVPTIYIDKNKVTQSSSSQKNQQFASAKVSIEDGCFIEIQGVQDTYILNFTGSLMQIKSDASTSAGLSSMMYGANLNSTYKQTMKTWLAYIGYIMSITILCLHFVFIGNQLLYKMDNLIIFIQTIYFFLFAKNLVGKLLTQFYYGWSFAHAQFLPNIFQGIIPDFYRERKSPCSYKLVNMDGNFFRNAGFSLFWLLVYVAAFFVIVFVLWVIYKLGRKKQIWYVTVMKQAFIAGIQFFSYNLIFFSMTQLTFSGQAYNIDQSYYNRSQALAIFILIVYSLYTIYRLITYPQGGLYMLKRIAISAILFYSYQNQILVIPLIFTQVVFCICRYILETPQKSMQKGFIALEGVLFIFCYLLLFLCVDTGVNTIIISIIIFILSVYLAYDLTTIYLEYMNEYSMQQLNFIYQQQKRKTAVAHKNVPVSQRRSQYHSRMVPATSYKPSEQEQYRYNYEGRSDIQGGQQQENRYDSNY